MNVSKQIAKHLRDVYFGGNWTTVNLKDTLSNVTWEQATLKVSNLNTIATLAYHVNYYVHGVGQFLDGQPLTTKDKLSFNHPSIESAEDWNLFLETLWKDGENFAQLIENLPESKIEAVFIDEKFGNYYRNLVGIIEHLHYHLGQIVLIKKLLNYEN